MGGNGQNLPDGDALQTSVLKTLSQGKRFTLFVFCVLPGNHTAACLAAYVKAATGREPDTVALRAALNELSDAGILAPGASVAGEVGVAYRLAVRFAPFTLRALATEATKYHWWPTEQIIGKGLPGGWLGAELAYSVRKGVDARQVWLVAETMRMILMGEEEGEVDERAPADIPSASVTWTAVGRLCDVLDATCPLSADWLGPRSVDRLLPALLEVGFLRTRDVRDLLARARTLIVSPLTMPSTGLLCAYCALCVWTGRADLLGCVTGLALRGSPVARFSAICRDAFEGRLLEAARAFVEIADDLRGASACEVSTPVWLLGLALAVAAGLPNTLVAKFARELGREEPLQGWHPAGREVVLEAKRKREGLAALILGVRGRAGAPQVPDGEAPTLEQIAEAVEAGYPTLVDVLCAAARGRSSGEGWAAKLMPRIEENGGVRLLGGAVSENAWKTALRELDVCLPAHGGAVRAEQALKGTIGWILELENSEQGGEPVYTCFRVVPVYRGPRGREDGRDDHRLTLQALASERYRACLTSQDAEILLELQCAAYDPRVSPNVPDAAVEKLCGHSRLAVCEPRWSLAEGRAHPAIALERRPCELTTERTPDGGMSLALPPWVFRSLRASYAIRRAEEGKFLYHPFTRRMRDVVGIFRAYGVDGRLVLPREALAEAKKLLERLVGVVSVSGAFAVGSDGFARTPGDPSTHVRLVYANDALSLSLVVEPLANRAVAACEPGVGHAERLVQLRGGKTVLLVRDLAAEEARAADVRAALEPFDAWATGRNRWLVDDAEKALDALRVLRGLADVCLDWPEGHKTRVSVPASGGVRINATGTDWFAVDGTVTFDDGRVKTLRELLRALAGREGNYVRFGEDDYLYLSGELLRRLETLATVTTERTAEDGRTVQRIPPAAVPMLARVFEGGEDEGLPQLPDVLAARADAIRTAFAETVRVPRRFKGELRAYQETGYVWLEHLASCGFGACLADDMGLGKTVQIIALLLRRAQEGVSLVVAPASVCPNWVREIERFAPDLRSVTLWDEKSLPSGLGAGDVVVASYGLLVSRADDFASMDWNGVVLDEAQSVKNAGTLRAQAARRLRARFRVAATGTPVENRLAEFWSIFSFLNPGLLGSERAFEARFTEGGFATKTLKRIVEPFVLRRLKRDVLRDLPAKTEITLRVTLGEEERAAYEACRQEALANLTERGETENRISILAALTRLRRFCCHPSLVLPEMTASAKLDAVLELLGDLREGAHRALVFSQYVDYLAIVRAAIEAKGWTCRYLDGTTPQDARAEAVDAFQRGDGDFFLISLKAGGTGLNLTAANYVLLLDPWWNPAVEDQAADRAHRIGQRLPVTVYRVVAGNTVEDRILDLHGEKRAVSDDLLESATGAALTPERLMRLFA